MNDKPMAPTREERLAQKLRENLKRRKAQARALEQGLGPADEQGEELGGAEALPKEQGGS